MVSLRTLFLFLLLVDQNPVRAMLLGELDRLRPVAGLDDHIVGAHTDAPDHFPGSGVIVGD